MLIDQKIGIVLLFWIAVISVVSSTSIVHNIYAVESISVILSGGAYDTSTEGEMTYDDITDISTSASTLKELEIGSGYKSTYAHDGAFGVIFPVKIPDPDNPNIALVKDANIHLEVYSIETKPDGLQVYYGKPGMFSHEIADREVSEGILNKTSFSEAQLTLYLK